MDSKVNNLLESNFKPIVLIKTDEKPENDFHWQNHQGQDTICI